MSTVSASKNIAQPNQQDNCYNLSVTTMKRKRGRPRKDGRTRTDKVAGSEPKKRSKLCPVRRNPISNDGLVGREVSCSFTGVFDAGYLLNVRVGGSDAILTGLVFDPRLSVPVSAENDIAPHLPMLGRNGFSLQAEGFINQGADSSQAGLKQHIQAKESPTTTSFTSHAQKMMEETPIQSSHAPQTVTETMEPHDILRISSVFVEGAATETPISAGLSSISASKPSNGYDLPEVFKPANVSEPSEAPEAVTDASGEPLNILKEALSTTKASFDVSDDSIFDTSKPSDTSKEEEASVVLKPSEASENAQKIFLDVSKEVGSCDGAFEATQVLEHQTSKTGDIVVEKLSSEKSSQRAEEEEASKGRRTDAS